MKRLLIIFLVFPLVLSSCDKIKAFWGLEEPAVPIQTPEEKTSYLLGYLVAKNTKDSEANLQNASFLQGIQHSLEGQPPILEPEEMKVIHQKIQEKVMLEKQRQETERNKMEGKNFLSENKNREGVKVSQSGLQYEVLTEGKGKSPTLENEVEVHYRGTFIDGTEFDSSYQRGAPSKFFLNQVIRGWTEGLQLMKEGGKYKFYIPSELAYGEQQSDKIPAHSTLIFEVELLKVGAAKAGTATPDKKPENPTGSALPESQSQKAKPMKAAPDKKPENPTGSALPRPQNQKVKPMKAAPDKKPENPKTNPGVQTPKPKSSP